LRRSFEHAVQYGDATELWVLERAGIQRADLVIAVTGDDEDNILSARSPRRSTSASASSRASTTRAT
jgi:trk system potassium uptake protein TrkA